MVRIIDIYADLRIEEKNENSWEGVESGTKVSKMNYIMLYNHSPT